jgi:superfamily II DNA/RNA helicase
MSTVPVEYKPLDDIIAVYHEILLNEIAVMRTNSILEEGVNTGDTIVYYSSSYPLYVGQPNSSRGIDIYVLAYAIINGIRRIECGYNILKPISPEPKCDTSKMKMKLSMMLSFLKGNTQHIENLSMEELIVNLILELIDLGLIYPVPSPPSDNLNMLSAKSLLTLNSSGLVFAEFNEVNPHSLYELKTYLRLRNFFASLNIEPEKISDLFVDKLRKKLASNSIKVDNIFFKTLHGMLYKYSSTASSLPFNPATLEANVLPFLIEPPPPTSYLQKEWNSMKKLTDEELLNVINLYIKNVAIKNNINDNSEKVEKTYTIVKEALQKLSSKFKRISQYQYQYLLWMFRVGSERENILTAITSPTGSGKTLIFLVFALVKTLTYKMLGLKSKTIILYPRKALARDQLGKIIEMVYTINELLEEEGLEKIILGIRDGDSLKMKEGSRSNEFNELRGLMLQNYKICHGVAGNKYEVFLTKDKCEITSDSRPIEWLKDFKDEGWSYFEKYDIIVTNHSILYRLANDALKATNLEDYKEILGTIRTVIIDEAHVYAKENLDIIATALLKIFYTRARLLQKTIPKDVSELVKDLDIVVSSATLSDQQIISKNGRRLYSGNIIGFFKLKTSQQNPPLSPSVENFLRDLFSEPVLDVFRKQRAIVYLDYDENVLKDLNVEIQNPNDRIIWRFPFKVKTSIVIVPYPFKNSWTALAEVQVALLHWLHIYRLRLSRLSEEFSRSLGIVFIDSKSTLKDIYNKFIERQILDAQDLADRVLFTEFYPYSLLSKNKVRKQALEQVIPYIDSTLSSYSSLYHLLTCDNILKDFTVLPLYFKLKDIILFGSKKIQSYSEMKSLILENETLYNTVKDLIDGLNTFASAYFMTENKGRGRYSEFLRRLERSSFANTKYLILMHHGDLGREERTIIESRMKGEKTPVPLIVLSTSTMELGVDIEHVPVVLQFASEPSSIELNQRMGRSGRSMASLNVATLVLVLRNTGEDLIFSRDQEAVEYVYNFTSPKTFNPFSNADVMLRHLTKLYVDKCIPEAEMCPTAQVLQEFVSSDAIRQINKELELRYKRWVEQVNTLMDTSQTGFQKFDVAIEKASDNIGEACQKIQAFRQLIRNKKALENLERELTYAYQVLFSIKFDLEDANKNEGTRRQFIRVNLIPYARMINYCSNYVFLLEEKYRNTVRQYNLLWPSELWYKIFSVQANLLSCLDNQFSIYSNLFLAGNSANDRVTDEFSEVKSAQEYLSKKLYLLDILAPGVLDDIGNPFNNHLLVSIRKGRPIIKMERDLAQTLRKERPLRIQLGE